MLVIAPFQYITFELLMLAVLLMRANLDLLQDEIKAHFSAPGVQNGFKC